MRLADDDRGRVPFAVVAVLLLLGSATFAATMQGRHPGGADPDPGAAIDRAESATRTVLVQAVDRAARRAARDPVVEPANTTYGRLLNGSDPFRNYLRVRVYLAARRSLEGVKQRVGDVRAGASLPPIEDVEDAKRAMKRVDLVENGSTLEVRFGNVTFTATRGDRTLSTERRSVTVGVETPVLALHDRTETFERRLDRGPLEGPGLGRRVTALLYGVAYARGLAFWHGAPIENVVANRHVEVLTNAAVLGVQRRTFGRADESARSVLAAAFLQVGLADLTAPVIAARAPWWVELVTGHRPPPSESISPYSLPVPDAPGPEDPMTVAVNGTADAALGAVVEAGGNGTVDRVLNRTYGANVQLLSDVIRMDDPSPPPVDPPGPDWVLENETANVTRTVSEGIARIPAPPPGWDGIAEYERHVEARWTYTRRWRRDNETTTTVARTNVTYWVGLLVADDHAPTPLAPDEPISVVHRRGGPVDAPNLKWVPENATERLVADRGGPGVLARRAVTGNLSDSLQRIEGVVPEDGREWIYRDLMRLRERVRNVSVEVPRGRVGTSVNPPGRLADRLESRRGELVAAPDLYRSVTDKARVAARGMYLDAVIERLREQAETVEDAQSGVGDALSEEGTSSSEATSMMERRGRSLTPGYVRVGDRRVRVTVDGAPSYLPVAGLTHENVPAVEPETEFHALVAENVNLFTVPYGDAGAAVADSLGKSSGNASLRTGARALLTAGRVANDNRTNATRLADEIDRLRADVSASVDRLVEETTGPVETVTGYGPNRSASLVRSGLARFNGTARRALALTNGSAVEPVVAAVDRAANLSVVQRDVLATKFRSRVVAAAGNETVRPPAGSVAGATNSTREVAASVERGLRRRAIEVVNNETEDLRDRFVDRYGDRIEGTLKRRASRVFPDGKLAVPSAGLPVLPSPINWYFTMNVWVVNVGGTYARFTARARDGGPSGRSIPYTRDGDAVSMDVDGDGTEERLGSASRVSFSTETVLLVAVPSGGRGVGDVDGRMFERSPGWCTPGPVEASRRDADCR